MSLKLPYDLIPVKYVGEEKRYIRSLKVWVENKDVLICTQLDSRYLLRANSVTQKYWEPVTTEEVAEALKSEPPLVLNEEATATKPMILKDDAIEDIAKFKEDWHNAAQDNPSLLDEEAKAIQDEQASLLDEEATADQDEPSLLDEVKTAGDEEQKQAKAKK